MKTTELYDDLQPQREVVKTYLEDPEMKCNALVFLLKSNKLLGEYYNRELRHSRIWFWASVFWIMVEVVSLYLGPGWINGILLVYWSWIFFSEKSKVDKNKKYTKLLDDEWEHLETL